MYLDNAATTQKPLSVIRKIEEVYSTINANIHRGVHRLSQLATEAHEEARKTVQHYIHAARPGEIIFTSGATGSINLIASSFCRSQCKAGDEIILTAMEHHANIVPWQIQRDITGIEIRVVPVTPTGEILLEELEERISSRTKLIALTHVSNVLGTVNPVAEIIRLAHSYNIPVLIDAAQSVQHIPIDVQALDCDFLVFSGHKIAQVTFEKTTFNDLPFKFEAGTPDYVGSAALAEAIRYIEKWGLENIGKYEAHLLRYATEKLMQIEGMQIIGTSPHKSSVISFLVGGIHPYDMGMLLDRLGIAVRTGHHCAQPLMDALGIEGTLRASFAFYNTETEIDILASGIERVAKMF